MYGDLVDLPLLRVYLPMIRICSVGEQAIKLSIEEEEQEYITDHAFVGEHALDIPQIDDWSMRFYHEGLIELSERYREVHYGRSA